MRYRLAFPAALFLFALATPLAGCGVYDQEDSHPKANPPDLTVRQSPNDTVRAGTRVRYTAVFADSLNPRYTVIWSLRDGTNLRGSRFIEWVAPQTPGDYRHGVTVEAGPGGATLGFVTVVIP